MVILKVVSFDFMSFNAFQLPFHIVNLKFIMVYYFAVAWLLAVTLLPNLLEYSFHTTMVVEFLHLSFQVPFFS